MATFYRRIAAMLFAVVLAVVSTISVAHNDEPVTITNPKTGKEYTFTSIALKNLKLLEDVLNELEMTEHLTTLQGMMLVETRAGTGGSVGLPNAHWTRRSYGVMQITLPTAHVILRDNPDILKRYFGKRQLQAITMPELKKFLLTNPRANIHLGAVLFRQYLEMVKGEWARAVAAYNMGIGNALARKDAPKAKYVRDVREWQRVAKALNEEQTRQRVVVAPVIYVTQDPVDIFLPSEDSQYTLPIKENYNGQGEEVQRQTYQEAERPQRSERTEEVEDSFGDYHTSFPDDR